MRLSEERISLIAKNICNELLDEELVDLEIAEDRFNFIVESLILEDFRIEDQIDEEAAAWLRKNKPYIEDGTPDWEIALDQVKEDLAIAKGYVIR